LSAGLQQAVDLDANPVIHRQFRSRRRVTTELVPADLRGGAIFKAKFALLDQLQLAPAANRSSNTNSAWCLNAKISPQARHSVRQ
jgi:hypothetical protein